MVLAPWNDVSGAGARDAKHGHELAAVITEPIMANMGCIPPREGYLNACGTHADYGALLILDEVVTGFRYAPGGCQEYYGIRRTSARLARRWAPVSRGRGGRSALNSRSHHWGDYMVLHYGTFNGHRLTMKVVAANLDLLAAEGVYRKLHAIGDAAIAGLREVFRRTKLKAIVQGFGPMFQIYFTDRDAIHDYRDYCTYVDTARYSRFVHVCSNKEFT